MCVYTHTLLYMYFKNNYILKLVCNMPVNSSLNLSLLHLTTVTFQKYFWMTSGALHVSLELRLNEIFRETL